MLAGTLLLSYLHYERRSALGMWGSAPVESVAVGHRHHRRLLLLAVRREAPQITLGW